MVAPDNPWPVLDRMDAVRRSLKWFESHCKTKAADNPFPTKVGVTTNREVYQKLLAIGPDYENNLEAFDEITGRPDFTRHSCDECAELADRVLVLGEYPPDYDFSTIQICLNCLRDAQIKLEIPPKETSQAS